MNHVADSIVFGLLRASFVLAASALLVALTIRLLRVASPRAERWAWLLVLLQGVLVVPIVIPLPESWRHNVPATAASAGAAADIVPAKMVVVPATEPAPSDQDAMTMPVTAAASPLETSSSVTTGQRPLRVWLPRWTLMALAIWLTGLVAMTVTGCVRYGRFLRRLRDVRVPSPEWSAEWRSVLSQAGVPSRIKLAVADDVGPVLFRSPRRSLVIVPEALWAELTTDERTAVLRHEVEHIRRGDLWWTLCARLLSALHWFNPCAWWAAANFDAQGELACDQAAGADGRLQFADLLMRLGTGTAGILQPVGVKAVASGRMYERIERLIAGPASTSRWRSAMPLAVVLLMAGFAAVKFERTASVAVAQDRATATDVASRILPSKATHWLGTAPYAMRGFPIDIAFSPDSRRVAAAEANTPGHVIRLFDVETAAEVMKLSNPEGGDHSATCIAYSPDGNRIAAGDHSGRLIVWDLEEQRVRFSEHLLDDRLADVLFSPDGVAIVVAGSRGPLQLRSAADPSQIIHELQSGAAKPEEFGSADFGGFSSGTIAFTPDGTKLVSASPSSGTVLVWNVATGTLIHTFNAVEGSRSIFGGPTLISVALTADGRSIFTSGYRTVPREETTLAFGAKNVWIPQNRLWDLDTGRMLRDFGDEHEYGLGAAALFPDGQQMVVQLYDQLVIRNLDSLEVQRRIPLQGEYGSNLTLSPDGKCIALQLGSRLAVFNTESGQRLHHDARAGTEFVMSADWSEGGDRVASAGTDGNVRVWDTATGEQLWSRPLAPYIAPTGDASRPWFVAFEDRYQTVIAAGSRDDAKAWRCGTVTIYNAATGQVRGDVTVRKEIRAGAVAPNGRVAVFAGSFGSADDTQLYGVDLMTLKVRFVSPPDDVKVGLWDVKAIEFLPDSSAFRVATGDSQVLEFDAETGEQRTAVSIDWRTDEQRTANMPRTPQLWEGAFSPDAGLLVSSSEEFVYLWDAATGEQRLKLQHPHKHGCRVGIAPDGNTIVTSDLQYAGDYGEDTIRFYDTSGKLLGTLESTDARANVLLFSPDGTQLFTGFFGQPPIVWSTQ